MVTRTNDQWLADLAGPPDIQAAALEDLRVWLARRLFFYLRSRSDLDSRADQEIEDMAEDFIQEALLQIQAKKGQFQGRSKFTTWASKVAVHQALAELRRARWRDFSLEKMTHDGEFTPSFLVQKSDRDRPEQRAMQSEAMQAVASAIEEELTERQKTALVAIAIQGVPIDVVADQLGTNRNALYKLLHDARKRLKNRLAERGYPVEDLLANFSG
ncbi:MAG: sigma-70 family RNA polymerase sigma factor [Chloroflexota bacterium]|nr:sigma-70 family RNA polymerase sigma factor [Chloroflexota bacterium]